MPATGGFGKSGVPDFMGIHKSRGFGIECKTVGNKPTALQTMQLELITAAGGFALVVNEVDGWVELRVFLNG